MKLTVLIFLFVNSVHAQIADTSFFPNAQSINPGISHLRTQGYISAATVNTKVKKKLEIYSGGISDGVKTEVELKKTSFYRAGSGPGMTIELMVGSEDATQTEITESTLTGVREVKSVSSSSFQGGILDFGFVGVSLMTSKYEHNYKFDVGSTPDLRKEDIITDYNYTVLKVGKSIQFGNLTVGAFYGTMDSKGDQSTTLYNPTTGSKGSTEVSKITVEKKFFGVGGGYTSKKYHFELSLEQISSQKLLQSNTYLTTVELPEAGRRLSLVIEMKFSLFAVGVRARQITGNYSDIEETITNNVLYSKIGGADSRLETSINFTLGKQNGLSLSGFYSESVIETEEETYLVEDEKYPVETKTRAMGINISYIY